MGDGEASAVQAELGSEVVVGGVVGRALLMPDGFGLRAASTSFSSGGGGDGRLVTRGLSSVSASSRGRLGAASTLLLGGIGMGAASVSIGP